VGWWGKSGRWKEEEGGVKKTYFFILIQREERVFGFLIQSAVEGHH
jgi:hypothetical protein